MSLLSLEVGVSSLFLYYLFLWSRMFLFVKAFPTFLLDGTSGLELIFKVCPALVRIMFVN